MILFVLLAALLWGAGRLMKLSPRARWSGLLLLYALFVALSVLVGQVPQAGGLQALAGPPPAAWLLMGSAVALVVAYRQGLRALHRRARRQTPPAMRPAAPAPAKDPEAPLSDGEVDRYMRHILLREVGGAGQMQLKRARVLVIGAGGLGSPALQYLAAAGVGTLGVIDDDVVDVSNLHRQIIHSAAPLGLPKVFSAQQALKQVNPHVQLRPYHRRLDEDNAADLIADYDLVLDGSDNFDTRYLVNRACVARQKPLIAAAITQWEGQISLYDPARGGPCYQCVFPKAPAPGLVPTCAAAGVIGPLPGVLGTMMALETLKYLTGAGEGLQGALLIYDGLMGDTRRIRLRARADCPVCACR